MTNGRTAPLGALTWRDQVRTGLVNLGWQPRDAEQAIAIIEPDLLAASRAGVGTTGGPDNPDEDGDIAVEVDVAVALRAALRALGRT